jgi:hypothetical protein
MSDDDRETEQERTWDLLYDRIRNELLRFGSEDFRQTADCWVDDDNMCTRQQKIYVRNLHLLNPVVIRALQNLLKDHADWEIMVAVSVPGTGENWPDMGLTIRAHEIVDGLQRSFFPKELQWLRYEGSRPGTDRD